MAGDRLLQLVAERLRAIAALGRSVARIGGDEFIVLSEQTEPRSCSVLASA
jgi:GGDEF domain-containing protein